MKIVLFSIQVQICMDRYIKIIVPQAGDELFSYPSTEQINNSRLKEGLDWKRRYRGLGSIRVNYSRRVHSKE